MMTFPIKNIFFLLKFDVVYEIVMYPIKSDTEQNKLLKYIFPFKAANANMLP